jgi:hypothetical protein
LIDYHQRWLNGITVKVGGFFVSKRELLNKYKTPFSKKANHREACLGIFLI